MKLPTSKQWLEIAEAFDRTHTRRSTQQKRIAVSGICLAVDTILNGDESDIPSPEYRLPDLILHKKAVSGFWKWDEYPCDRQRAFFCCMMSAVTEAGDMKAMIGDENANAK